MINLAIGAMGGFLVAIGILIIFAGTLFFAEKMIEILLNTIALLVAFSFTAMAIVGLGIFTAVLMRAIA